MSGGEIFAFYFVPAAFSAIGLALAAGLAWLVWSSVTDDGARPLLPNDHERRLVDAALDARRAAVLGPGIVTGNLSRPSLWRYKRESLRIDQDHETTKLRASADAVLDRLIAEQERRRGH